MTIFPAIDLYKGSVVRLTRGDYSKMTVYSTDPLAVARGFREAGAVAAHVVDLEGARDGEPLNFDVIRRIAEESGLEIQVGGGIRNMGIIERYLSAGVRRVILGTAAASDPGFISELAGRFGDAAAVSVDIKDGRVAIKGWTDLSEHDALDFCHTAVDLGVRTLICTDISKDGMLGGTNMELYRAMRKELPVNLIASGGITSLGEVRALSALGMDGAILGRALYTGDLDLKECIRSSH